MSNDNNTKCQILNTTQDPTGQSYEVRLFGPICEFEQYDELFELLSIATEEDIIDVSLSCCGGSCEVGFSIVRAVQACKAKEVNMIVAYPSYSMGSIIALSGTSLTFLNNTFLMFHTYSSCDEGKVSDTQRQFVAFNKIFTERFKDVCCPFLTQAEVQRMFSGEDLYIHDTDLNVPQRILRHFNA